MANRTSIRVVGAVLILLGLVVAAFLYQRSDAGESSGTGAATEIARGESAADATPPTSKSVAPGPRRRAISAGSSGARVRLRGRVVDDRGRVVAQAHVWAADDVLDVFTDAQGTFRAAVPRALQDWSLQIVKDGFVARKAAVLLGAEDTLDLGDLVLKRGVRVRGIVVDAAARPLAGARVRFVDGMTSLLPDMRTSNHDSVTGSDGRFELLLDDPGRFRLRAQHPAHAAGVVSGVAAHRGDIVAGLRIVLADGATISGSVSGVPAATGKLMVVARLLDRPADASPVAAAAASMFGDILADLGVGGHRSDVDAGGRFAIDGLTAGKRYRLVLVRLVDHRAEPCSAQQELRAPARDVALLFDEGATVVFRVRDASTHQPIDKVQVSAGLERTMRMGLLSFPITSLKEHKIHPDNEGRFRLTGVRPRKEFGLLTLQLTATGYTEYKRDRIRVPRRGGIDLGVIALEAAPTVRVDVVAAQGGSPIEKASVVLIDQPKGQTDPRQGIAVSVDADVATQVGQAMTKVMARGETDADGVSVLTAKASHEVTVRVVAKGFAEYRSEPIRIGASGELRHRVALTRGGTVEVRVQDPRGGPVAEARVARRLRGETTAAARVADVRGHVLFANLAPGTHEFRLEPKKGSVAARLGMKFAIGDHGSWQAVDVVEGGTAELVLVAPDRGTLTGVVTENGTPLARAEIRLATSDEQTTAANEAGKLVMKLAQVFAGGLLGGADIRTDADGRFRVKDVAVGTYVVHVNARGMAVPAEFRVRVVTGDNSVVLPILSASVAGRVTDAAGPVRRAAIHVEPAAAPANALEPGTKAAFAAVHSILGGKRPSSVKTDLNGEFRLVRVPCNAPFVVVAESSSHVAGRSPPIRLRSGESRRGVALRLAPAGRIRVHAAKDRTAGIRAEFVGAAPHGVPPRFVILKHGSAMLRSLTPGRWEVSIDGPKQAGEAKAGAAPKRIVEVVAGKTTRVTFD